MENSAPSKPGIKHLERVDNIWIAKAGLIDTYKTLTIHGLAHYPMLVQGHLSGSGLYLNKWLQTQGVVLPETLICDSMTDLLGLTIAGMGITYLPGDCFRYMADEGKLDVIETDVTLPRPPMSRCIKDNIGYKQAGICRKQQRPWLNPYCWKPAGIMAAVAEVGNPSVKSGIKAPDADVLLAASGPATPSIAPVSHVRLRVDWRFRWDPASPRSGT